MKVDAVTADGMDASGYILLKKRAGIGSFDSLNLVKKALGTGRVGHSGTLDKFAEGLLIVLVGRSTRLVPWFTGCDKVYIGDFFFGEETDTLDPEGTVIAEGPIPSVEEIRSALSAFIGPIMQVPPLYSSVHVHGVRAHRLARAGADMALPPRPISIHSLELLSYQAPIAKIRVSCSKGTYIRSLARDLARSCGSRGRLAKLVRTQVADFRLENAVDPLEHSDPLTAIRENVAIIERDTFAALGIPTKSIPAALNRSIAFGQPIDPGIWGSVDTASPLALVSEDGRFLAIIERIGQQVRYGYVAIRPEDV